MKGLIGVTIVIVFTTDSGICSFLPVDAIVSGLQSVVTDSLAVAESSIVQLLALPPGSGLSYVTQRATSAGNKKRKYRQSYNGIEVFGSGITVELNSNNKLMEISSYDVSADIHAATSVLAAITPDAAYGFTAQYFNLTRANLADSWNLKTTLYLYRHTSTYSLTLCYLVAFFVHVSGTGPLAPTAFVNAANGQILEGWNGINTQSVVTMNGVGGNSGIWGQQLYTDLHLTQLADHVTCTYSTANVQVRNLAGATSGALSPWSLPCSQTVNSSYDQINSGYAAMNDVARHSEIVVAMYQDYLGVTSPTGTLPLLARVHYGSGYDNSFWDSTQINLGDGSSIFYPLSSLDVIGHEFSHAFTNLFSKLIYSGQPGGISESFADIAGEAAEFYYNNTNDFIVGRLVSKNGVGHRFLCNPTADGVSIGNAADYVAGMDVHYSCGVYNKAFCNLAKTSGWDTSSAFRIFAFANAVYWTEVTNFTRGVCGLQLAATDCGMSATDVANAFSTVGLACA